MENGTYFTNPSSPQRICNLMIRRQNDEICQIRLELDEFDLAPPNENGECNTDFFLVTGGSHVPPLCGLNTGQHLVYSITHNSGPTQLSMVMDTTQTTSSTRQWTLRVYQFECSSRMLAPVGCLQYYTGASGDFKSFNYRSEISNTNPNGPNHLANLNYAVCIRVSNGYCGIKYSQSQGDPYSFTVSEDASGTLAFPLPAANVMLGDTDCSTDYIIIPNGSEAGEINQWTRDRYCGITLGTCDAQMMTCTQAIVGPVTSKYSNELVESHMDTHMT